MKKKKQQTQEKLRLVKEIVRKQLGEVTGGRKCLTGTDGDTGTDGGTNSCAGPP